MYREDMRPVIVDSFIREFNKNGPKLNLSHMVELKDYEPEVYARVMEAYRTHWDLLLNLLEKGAQDGTLKKGTRPQFILNLFQYGMESLYSSNVLERSKLTYSEAIVELADTIFSGILAD